MGIIGAIAQGTVRIATFPVMSEGNSIAASQKVRDSVDGTPRSATEYTAVANYIDNPPPTLSSSPAPISKPPAKQSSFDDLKKPGYGQK